MQTLIQTLRTNVLQYCYAVICEAVMTEMSGEDGKPCSLSLSSTSSIAPTDFNIHTPLTDHMCKQLNSALVENKSETKSLNWRLKCGACCYYKSVFFCCDCIKNGDFTYSKQRFPERFADKKLKLFKLKGEQMDISRQMDALMRHQVIRSELEFSVRSLESNIENLRTKLNKAKQALNISRMNVLKSRQNQNEYIDRRDKICSKIQELKVYLSRRQSSINKAIERRDKLYAEMADMVRQRVSQLTTYIFPIKTISLNEISDKYMLSNTESTPLLNLSDSNSNTAVGNYIIVEPWIPANGDYSEFLLFANNRRDYSNKESNFLNPEYRIGAALAYITQFINILSYYLDIRQPKRLSYSEFYKSDLTDAQFAQKVAKLNANVLYLCLSQNVDSEILHPRHTIKNLLHLLNPSTAILGIRNGPIHINGNFLETMEDSLLNDLCLIDEPDIEDCYAGNGDEELTDFDWVEPNIPDLHFTLSGQQISIASGFMSNAAASVASIWKKPWW